MSKSLEAQTLEAALFVYRNKVCPPATIGEAFGKGCNYCDVWYIKHNNYAADCYSGVKMWLSEKHPEILLEELI